MSKYIIYYTELDDSVADSDCKPESVGTGLSDTVFSNLSLSSFVKQYQSTQDRLCQQDAVFGTRMFLQMKTQLLNIFDYCRLSRKV